MTRELADLEHHLDLALKVDFAAASAPEKEADLLAVTRIRAKVAALDHRVLMPFEASQQHRAQGHTSPIGWLEHNARVRGVDAAGRRRLSRRLRHHPLAEEAMAAGRLTEWHLLVLDRARRLLGDDLYHEHAEAVLVECATTERYEDFVRTVDYFLARAGITDPDDPDEDERYCSSSATLGGGKVDAALPPLEFSIFDDELQRLTEHLYRLDVAEARDRLGRDPLSGELSRSARQRRAAALVLMAQRSAAHGDAEVAPSRFVVNLHCGAQLLAKILDKLIAALRDGDDDEIDLAGITLEPEDLCEDDAGRVVTVNTMILALLTGTVRGFLFDPDGVPLRYGRDRRIFSPAQGDAIRARYRRCAHPYGCGRTGPRWLQSNHVTEHRHGGRTDIENADPRCGPHNWWWTNTFGQDPPDGAVDRDQRRLPPDFGPLDFTQMPLPPLGRPQHRPKLRRGYRWAS